MTTGGMENSMDRGVADFFFTRMQVATEDRP